MIIEAAAPPIGGACFAGIITGSGSSIKISQADVNMTVELKPAQGNGLLCEISLEVALNLTNSGEGNKSVLLLYNPCWVETPYGVQKSDPKTSLDGACANYSITAINNVTHPRQLPAAFGNRFPSWVWVHDEIWQNPLNFTMVNITLGGHTARMLKISDAYTVDSYLVDYYEAGFGFSAVQVQADRTPIITRITLLYGSGFERISFFPTDSVESTQAGDECTGLWRLEYPYSQELLYGSSPEPIRAGCSVYITIVQWNPPTPSPTTITTDTTGADVQTTDPFGIALLAGALLAAASVMVYYHKHT